MMAVNNNTKPILPADSDVYWFCSLTTRRLKQMWDSEDYEDCCDEIHAAMNYRGQGEYVAV